MKHNLNQEYNLSANLTRKEDKGGAEQTQRTSDGFRTTNCSSASSSDIDHPKSGTKGTVEEKDAGMQ